jgi:hypothetical protein
VRAQPPHQAGWEPTGPPGVSHHLGNQPVAFWLQKMKSFLSDALQAAFRVPIVIEPL